MRIRLFAKGAAEQFEFSSTQERNVFFEVKTIVELGDFGVHARIILISFILKHTKNFRNRLSLKRVS